MDVKYNHEVGFRIRSTRETMGLSRESFSELCSISSSFLSDVERGNKSITIKTLNKICTVSNVSADYIVFGDRKRMKTFLLFWKCSIILTTAPSYMPAGFSVNMYRQSSPIHLNWIKKRQQANRYKNKGFPLIIGKTFVFSLQISAFLPEGGSLYTLFPSFSVLS